MAASEPASDERLNELRDLLIECCEGHDADEALPGVVEAHVLGRLDPVQEDPVGRAEIDRAAHLTLDGDR